MRQVIIYPGEDGYWVAECPSLPGCVSQGKTKEEAIANIREAIQGYIAALEEDHLPVLPDSEIHISQALYSKQVVVALYSFVRNRFCPIIPSIFIGRKTHH